MGIVSQADTPAVAAEHPPSSSSLSFPVSPVPAGGSTLTVADTGTLSTTPSFTTSSKVMLVAAVTVGAVISGEDVLAPLNTADVRPM